MEQKQIVLCDTNIIIEFYKNNKSVLSQLRKIGHESITISVITAGELIYGALNRNELNKIQKDINSLLRLDLNDSISEIFLDIMMKYSLSHNLLVPDGLIAATAMYYQIPLYTLNVKDFKYIKGLELLNN